MTFNAGTFAMLNVDLLELDAENVRQVRDVAAFLSSPLALNHCKVLLESRQADPATHLWHKRIGVESFAEGLRGCTLILPKSTELHPATSPNRLIKAEAGS